MTLFTTVDPRPIHFMGIAGAGMSGLALLAKEQAVAITGCDNDPTGAADLAANGVEIWRGHDPGHVAGARAVVVTAAVPGDHPELKRARALGVPVVRRADALSQAVAGGTVVAVAGTHGKTTTTVMVTEALAAAGRDPTGLAGGRVARWGGNARMGGRDLYVVEADEYDRAFLSLAPAVAVVNNVEADHLECYDGSVAALEQAFAQFASRARRVIAGGDDAGALRVVSAVRAPVWRVGLGADADVRIADAQLDEQGSTARIELPGGGALALRLRVPGLHNVRNAAAALAVVHELGAGRGGLRGGGAGGRRSGGGWRRRCKRETSCSPWGRAISRVSDRSCSHASGRGRGRGRGRDATLAALAAAGAAGRRGVGVARAVLARRAGRAAAACDVSRAPDRARGRAQSRAGRRDRGAAAGAQGECVRRHAVARRSGARTGGRSGGAGGPPVARRPLGGAAGGGARGARGGPARIGKRPSGGGCSR